MSRVICNVILVCLLLLICSFVDSPIIRAQKETVRVVYVIGVPSSCVSGRLYVNVTTGFVYSYKTGVGCFLTGEAITGSGANTRVAHWGGASALTSTNGFTFSTNNLSIPSGGQFQINGSQIAFSNLSGNIAIAQINSGTSASASTFLRGDNTWSAPFTASNSQATLASSFAVTVDNTWQDTGLAITLPAAGTYNIFADVRASVVSTVAGSYIETKFFNFTDTADVANSETMCIVSQVASGNAQVTCSMKMIVTVAASKSIRLYALRPAGFTYSVSSINSDSAGRTRMGYIRLN